MVPVAYLPPTSCCLGLASQGSPQIPHLPPFWFHWRCKQWHNSDVIMSAMAFQIPGVSIVYSTVCSGADQRKHQSSASLAFMRGIHRGRMNSPHKGPVTRKKFCLKTSSLGAVLQFINLILWEWATCATIVQIFIQNDKFCGKNYVIT